MLTRRLRPAHQLRLHNADLESATGRILFVSHEATRTGAPKIILNLLKHFREKTNASLHTILHRGGQLAEEFAEYSHVDCLNVPRHASNVLQRKLRRIGARTRHDPPLMAICNSMESRFIAYELAAQNIPILFLVHELPSSYEQADYEQIYDCSQRVIFPVQTVRDAAHAKAPIPLHKGMVLPQGLLDTEFGQGIARDEARAQIPRELSLPQHTHVVLGCGTLDLRKGIDHFAAVARHLLQHGNLNCPVHFVWLGDGPRWFHSPYHYVQLDINNGPAKGFVHFIGERENVEPYFMGADTFLLTSRVDPCPCVIHEAMATELPIIAFDNSGGAPEALSDGAGILVPFGDHRAMAEMIRMLAVQPNFADNLRHKALEKVATRFRFDHYANRIIQLAEEVAKRRFAVASLDSPDPHIIPFPGTSDAWRRAA